MYPFGNGRVINTSPPWKFSCQHGGSECAGNMYEACAIKHNNATASWWPMVNCMESSKYPGDATVASGCATKAGLDWSVIKACAGDNPQYGSPDDGNPNMYSIAMATQNLQPPHQWTPWVVLNGKPLTSAQLDDKLTTLICNAYTGPKPAGCTAAGAKVCMQDMEQ